METKKNHTSPESPLKRFQESMVMDFEKWHDGIGYDLAALREASAPERQAIEKMILDRSPRDWRDIEALASLDTPTARIALREALEKGDPEVRMAVARYAPGLMTDKKRSASLVRALKNAKPFEGLSDVLQEAEDFHPPEVIRALFRGALQREGEVAVHFAALLFFLHGKAKSPFDWNHRPFFLRFHTEDRAEREQVFRELCQIVGANAARWGVKSTTS